MPKAAKDIRDDWYWACSNCDGPAGDLFVIENGQDALWARVRQEIDRDEDCAWMAVHRYNRGPHIDDLLDMLLTVVPAYGVNHNRFVFEAAKIPIFAEFLRGARSSLCNYVSNIAHRQSVSPEPYEDRHMRRLGSIVSATLGIEADWVDA